MTPGSTKFELNRVIFPSIPAIDPSRQISKKVNGTLINFDYLFNLAKISRAIYTAKTSFSAVTALTTGKLGAAVVNPTVGLAASAAVSVLCQEAVSEYKDRYSSLPQLKTYFHGGLVDDQYFIAASTDPHNETYWSWDGEVRTFNPFPRPPLCYPKREFSASLPIEGIPTRDQVPSQITIPGLISVKIEEMVVPGCADSPISQLVISHCGAKCRGQDCETECGPNFQTCLSPDGMKLGGLTMRPDGQRICVGFSDGTIGILNKSNGDDPTLHGWLTTYEAGEGKPLSQLIKEHKQRLTGHTNRKVLSHAGGAAAAAASFAG